MSKVTSSINHALLIEEAAELAEGDTRLMNTYMKELLHHDMMAALVNDGWANALTFKGGTCLRLAYGGSRLSEDLDFNHSLEFDSEKVDSLAKSIEQHVASIYELPTFVKIPKRISTNETGSVMTWQLQVQVAPGRKDVPAQKIKIDLSATPSYTREFTPIASKYNRRIKTASNDVLPIYSESKAEIASDKVIAFANRPGARLKARDIWDLVWLKQQGVVPNHKLIEAKAADYQLTQEQFIERMDTRIGLLNTPDTKKAFTDEMSRFLTSKQRHELLGNPDFINYVFEQSAHLLGEQKDIATEKLRGNELTPDSANKFKM